MSVNQYSEYNEIIRRGAKGKADKLLRQLDELKSQMEWLEEDILNEQDESVKNDMIEDLERIRMDYIDLTIDTQNFMKTFNL